MPDQTHHEALRRVGSRPGASVRQRAMPVVRSILWKPLRDSHYVLASVQPDQGGLRQVFVLQSVLGQIHRLAHGPSGAHLVGLLLGSRYDCPITGTRYVLVESLDDIAEPTQDAKAITAVLAARVSHHVRNPSVECVGWYAASDGSEPHVSNAQMAVHASLFKEPWPTALILAGGGGSGAFFLHDKRAARWFPTPFYEVGNADGKGQAAKSTCIAWPSYLTVEKVVFHAPAETEKPSESVATAEPAPSRRSALSSIARIGSAIRSSISGRAEEKARKAADLAEQTRVAEAERKKQARGAHAERLERARASAAELAQRDRLAAEQAERERLATEQAQRERLAAEQERIARPAPTQSGTVRPVEPAPVQRRHTPPRAIDDGEDTTPSDHPYRYLALARREGFQVTANLEVTLAKGTETVWLLNEEEFGLQITLVTSDVAVVEATLHYNIRIRDDAVLRATRPEHRHLDSRTIYVRESCVESLRARCRQLRATGALQRDWKVTPHIYPPGPAT